MSSTMQTRQWIAFFQAAGIHDHVLAARYAAIFVENEINTTMLNELDMELLRVMGISKVGHVLGILKHAKLVHHTQLFADSQPSPQRGGRSSRSSSPLIVSAGVKRGRPITTAGTPRIIEHYVHTPKSDVDVPKRSAVLDQVGVVAKKPRLKVTARLASDCPVANRPETPLTRVVNLSKVKSSSIASRVGMKPAEVPTRAVASVPQRTQLSGRLGLTRAGVKVGHQFPKRKREVAEEVPVAKRPRRVLPEHEGGYSISMPAGTTPRSREILAKMAARQSKTVFDRLGDPAVSSTTEIEPPTITITGFGTQIVRPGSSGSVFNRLGGKAKLESTATTGIKSRLGKQVNFKPTPTLMIQNHMLVAGTASGRVATSTLRRAGISSRSEALPSSTTLSDEIPYSGVLKKQFSIRKTPATVTRLGMAPKLMTTSSGIKSAPKRNDSAGILGNPVNATKLSAKARLDLSSKPPVRSDTKSKMRKFIMTNKKTGVQTIVYKIAQE